MFGVRTENDHVISEGQRMLRDREAMPFESGAFTGA
jgi:hypothetical protein